MRFSCLFLVSFVESLVGFNFVVIGYVLVRKEREEGGNLKIFDEDDKNYLIVICVYEL